jgi:hypothetical protein
MSFTHYDIGYRQAGELVEVTLARNSANVKLMDSTNFQSYHAGRRHTYYGGHATYSPYRIAVPHAGNWHVAVDLGGYAGSVQSSVRTIRSA